MSCIDYIKNASRNSHELIGHALFLNRLTTRHGWKLQVGTHVLKSNLCTVEVIFAVKPCKIMLFRLKQYMLLTHVLDSIIFLALMSFIIDVFSSKSSSGSNREKGWPVRACSRSNSKRNSKNPTRVMCL